jgi:hypothetical protein
MNRIYRIDRMGKEEFLKKPLSIFILNILSILS